MIKKLLSWHKAFAVLVALVLLLGQSHSVHADLEGPPGPPLPEAPTCNGLEATIFVATLGEDEIIIGGPDDGDTYTGTLNGTSGQDVIVGTENADIILPGNQNDTVCALGGNDTVTDNNGHNWVDAGEGNNTVTTGNGQDTISSGSGDDIINAGGGHNNVNAGDGTNDVTAGNGNDTITTGNGDDTVSAGGGHNTINVNGGSHVITSGNGNDTINTVGNSTNVINAGNGHNNITTGDSDDTITTGNGNDTIVTGGGNDKVTSGNGHDNVNLGDGNDSVVAKNGNDTLNGGPGIDYCEGGSGNNTITNCEFSGEDGDGVIVIIKDAIPDDEQDFEFTGDLGVFSLDDDEDGTLSDTEVQAKEAGSYDVTESLVEGWTLNSITCYDPDGGTTVDLGTRTATIDLDEGEVVTCIFENEEDEEAILGCTDPEAINYDPEATEDDDSCEYVEYPFGFITNPENGDTVSGTIDLTAEYYDGDDANDDIVQWAVRAGTCAAGQGTVFGNVDGHSDSYDWDGSLFSSSFDTTQHENGEYCFIFNPKDDSGEPNVRETSEFTIENEEPHICEPGVNLVENGGFEDPVVAGPKKWNTYPNGTAGLDWTVKWVRDVIDNPDVALLELHRLVKPSWTPFEGDQYTELDSHWGPPGSPGGNDASVKINQKLDTVIGETYTIDFAYSPRPGTGEEENKLKVFWEGVLVDTIIRDGSENSGTDWETYSYEVVATSENSKLKFRESGDGNGKGSFLDDVSVTCNAPEQEISGRLSGKKYYDEDYNGKYKKQIDTLIPGWIISLYDEFWNFLDSDGTNDKGKYKFNGLAEGTYYVCEDQEEGWWQTDPESDGRSHVSVVANGSPDSADQAENCYEVVVDLENEKTGGLHFGNYEHSCLVEGYKYDHYGNPLSGWTIGLAGYGISQDEEFDSEYDIITTDVTDENGYYCLYEYLEEGSNYKVFEEMQEGWEIYDVMVNGESEDYTVDSFFDVFVEVELYDDLMVDFYNYYIGSENGGSENGTIIIHKETTPDGDDTEFTFYGDISTSLLDDEFSSHEVAPGQYAIYESELEDWDLIDAYCDDGTEFDEANNGVVVDVSAGETVHCYFYNEEQGQGAFRQVSSSNSSGGGQVLGATTFSGGSCDPLLDEYLFPYLTNDVEEVAKLQTFLTMKGFVTALTGIFDASTEASVRAFQSAHSDEILQPWVDLGLLGVGETTGSVYKTTRWKINNLVCPGSEVFPVLP